MKMNQERFVIVLSALCTLYAVHINAAPATDDSPAVHSNDNENQESMFEGDLKLSNEFVLKHYNFSSIPGGEELLKEYKGKSITAGDNEDPLNENKRAERAAGRSTVITLWSNAIVRYRISTTISKETATLIRNAMDHLEDRTCLKFILAESGNYIEFTNTQSGCFSNSIGQRGGKQIINLGPRCKTFGIIVHEIGHAIGFWHEQSRPDRDGFVTVNTENIKEGRASQFMKRNNNQVDSLNSRYDYGSIMHYRSQAFSKPGCEGPSCITLLINNPDEYARQGRPTLGQRDSPSAEDIIQINRLYTCPKPGVNGFLMYRVMRGTSLPDTDPASNSPDPYVRLISVDSNSNQHVRQTSVKDGTTDPVWNEWVSVSEREWQFFRISVWDDDNFLTFGDDQMSISQTVVIEPGEHTQLRHCEDHRCNGYVTFDYQLLSSIVRGKLQVKVRSARSLDDTDPIWNSPDPYVRIEAKQSTGAVQTKSSRVISGTTNPTWNQWLNYDCQRWAFFEIQVWDDDDFFTGGDDQMSDKELVFVRPGNHQSVRHDAHGSGHLLYDYNFIVDGNECNPSPCRNGGTCRDGCSSYTCTCRSGYAGTNCQYVTGNLRVTARYARNLPDEDGWWNNSDPYMEFIAIDQNGNSVRKTTGTKGGNQNPNWNESLNFGNRAWKQLKVKVYDNDDNADDALSNQQTIVLSTPVQSRTVVRHNCHSGYAIFDYSYN